MSDISLFHGPNAGYVLELYDRYLQDPQSVDADMQILFNDWSPDKTSDKQAPLQNSVTPAASETRKPKTEDDIKRIVGAARVTRMVREIGHLAAGVDPLGSAPPGDSGLELETHGLTAEDLSNLPPSVVGGPLAEGAQNALEALGRLRRVYSGSVGYDISHVSTAAERNWLYDAIESRSFFPTMDADHKTDLLERLTEVETFERYLHKTFQGAKRFSIEGNDTLVPMLDEIIHHAALSQTREVVMGMAHRGRLNVMAHVLGKPYEAILSAFAESSRISGSSVAGRGSKGWTGDVKYHLGARRAYKENNLAVMPISLVPNPSHLEFADPVVEGHVRAAQEQRAKPGPPLQDEKASLAILIHGDSAFPGQGIVAETLNLWNLPGYRTGGTIHIITNNQIGFTTDTTDSRSTQYAGDLAKGFEIPIVHVNADDPEACLAMSRMALAYREHFQKDFLIDLVGYRRHGHNEGDEPAYTQPKMYDKISTHPTVRAIWAKILETEGLVTAAEAEGMVTAAEAKLTEARNKPVEVSLPENGDQFPRIARVRSAHTAISAEALTELNEALLVRPNGFTPNVKLQRTVFARRRTALSTPNSIDWGHAETLAFASILADGTPIRLSGQDSERGTFGQRHLVLHDTDSGSAYIPLQHLKQARASFAVYNSPLSENAVLGFEYGYSMHAPGVMTIWEAQFGDFCNSAQVIIDQFLVSGNAKWRQIPSLVLLLPHGYEGMGPEHSSARLERFLQLAANDNIRVVNCTTAAQYFHLLRRQAALLETEPRPLIVMSPKSLLRHPRAASSISELTEGSFQSVINDARAAARSETITRLVLCSGKVYTDLVGTEQYTHAERVAVVRVEELYPFPEEDLRRVMGGYPNLQEITWLQEEPCNMGAWIYMASRIKDILGWSGDLNYAGRLEAASTAEGSAKRHEAEQSRLLEAALHSIPQTERSVAMR